MPNSNHESQSLPAEHEREPCSFSQADIEAYSQFVEAADENSMSGEDLLRILDSGH